MGARAFDLRSGDDRYELSKNLRPEGLKLRIQLGFELGKAWGVITQTFTVFELAHLGSPKRAWNSLGTVLNVRKYARSCFSWTLSQQTSSGRQVRLLQCLQYKGNSF